ncbi:MAG: S26 family signal peptidase, partial [Leeuwenhoekiella sp.]
PQYSYTGTATGGFNAQNLYEQYDLTDGMRFTSGNDFIVFSLTEESAERFKDHPNVSSLERNVMTSERIDPTIFPKGKASLGNRDQMKSFYIPKKGATTPINSQTLPFYKRLIEVYEGDEMGISNTLTQNGTQILLNGTPISSYTFKQNYYWMMGDNRHNSEDSRFWGFVPENHIVGKPVLIFMSWDSNGTGFNKIRWERLFTTVGGEGEPVSYLWYVVILIIGYFVVSKIIKIKRGKKL